MSHLAWANHLARPPRPTSDTPRDRGDWDRHFYSHFYILLLPLLFLDRDGSRLASLNWGDPDRFCVFAFCKFIGFLVDRLGARNILILGLIWESLCFIAMGLDASYWTPFFAYVIAGIANGVYHLPITRSCRPRCGRSDGAGVQPTLLAAISASGGVFTIILLAEFPGWRHA